MHLSCLICAEERVADTDYVTPGLLARWGFWGKPVGGLFGSAERAGYQRLLIQTVDTVGVEKCVCEKYNSC